MLVNCSSGQVLDICRVLSAGGAWAGGGVAIMQLQTHEHLGLAVGGMTLVVSQCVVRAVAMLVVCYNDAAVWFWNS